MDTHRELDVLKIGDEITCLQAKVYYREGTESFTLESGKVFSVSKKGTMMYYKRIA